MPVKHVIVLVEHLKYSGFFKQPEYFVARHHFEIGILFDAEYLE
jgi:hypothetical protein